MSDAGASAMPSPAAVALARFRAGYDFLLLRCESGELDAELGEWWTEFYDADPEQREELLSVHGVGRVIPRRRRRFPKRP